MDLPFPGRRFAAVGAAQVGMTSPIPARMGPFGELAGARSTETAVFPIADRGLPEQRRNIRRRIPGGFAGSAPSERVEVERNPTGESFLLCDWQRVTHGSMEQLGFFVCVQDLEDELIRASGRAVIETLLDSQGDLGSFRTLQKQPAWRQKGFEAQVHRWLRAGARRNLRYARLLVLSLHLDQMPRPLEAVLATTSTPTRQAG